MSRAAEPTTTTSGVADVSVVPVPPLMVPPLGRLYSAAMALRDGDPVWFYELHEGDDDLFADVLLAHDVEYDEQELLDLVLEARTAVIGSFTEDTLSEAVGNELARKHGFLVVDDSQLRAAVTVSAHEGETRRRPGRRDPRQRPGRR